MVFCARKKLNEKPIQSIQEMRHYYKRCSRNFFKMWKKAQCNIQIMFYLQQFSCCCPDETNSMLLLCSSDDG